jgi:hypothetical protein
MRIGSRYAITLQRGDIIRYWGKFFRVEEVTPNTDHVAVTLKNWRGDSLIARLQKTQILDVVEK